MTSIGDVNGRWGRGKVNVAAMKMFCESDPLNCAEEFDYIKEELQRHLIYSLGGKEKYDKLVESGWTHNNVLTSPVKDEEELIKLIHIQNPQIHTPTVLI